MYCQAGPGGVVVVSIATEQTSLRVSLGVLVLVHHASLSVRVGVVEDIAVLVGVVGAGCNPAIGLGILT